MIQLENSIYRLLLLNLFCVFGLSLSYAQNFSNVQAAQGINTVSFGLDYWGDGVSFYDFNNDGWDDLSLVVANGVQGIYENVQGSFQPASMIVSNFGETKHFLWVDYDNDRDLDIFLTTKTGRNKLLQNNGSFVFTDVTTQSGISEAIAENYGAAFGDYNKDGFLDLYLSRYASSGDSTDINLVNNLYHNNGDGTFTDVSFAAGVEDNLKSTFMAVWFDYNNDTWPDLYVANDRFYDGALYHNNADGTFTNVSQTSNVSTNLISNYMTSSVADYNNDKDLDLFLSNTAYTMNDLPRLFDNLNNGSFQEIANPLGLELLEETTWGGLWLDYDNDGWQDLFVATDYLNNNLPAVPDYLFKNVGGDFFVDSSSILENMPLSQSHAVARGDFNNDGFYDIFAKNDGPLFSHLWENSGNSNNYIKITLEGTNSNSYAIGSWIHVFVEDVCQTQYTFCGENYLGQNSQHHIFGIKDATIVDSVHVIYLSGITDKYYNLDVDSAYHFIEGETLSFFEIDNLGNDTICYGDTALLQAPSFESYLWNTGDNVRSLEVYQSGSYSLVAIDSFGLSHYSDMVQVHVLDPIQTELTINNVSCHDEQDGFIVVQVMDSSRAYNISWSNGRTGNKLDSLAAGIYTYNYIDAFSCVFEGQVLIEAPFELNVQYALSPASPTQLGALSLLVNGGTTPYQFFIDAIPISENVSDLDTGIYFLEVRDSMGCYWSKELEVLYLDLDTTTSLNTAPLSSMDFNIYPNPFQNSFTLSFSTQEKNSLSIDLYDVTGRIIVSTMYEAKIGVNDFAIQLDDEIPSGCYFLKIESQEGSISKILLKH